MSVSVALCTFNGEKFIEEQINSFLSQTVLPDEIVVCDDGSTDNTLSIVSRLVGKLPGISLRILRNETNLGASRNFEKAINMCTKDIILLSDQDDVWEDTKVEKLVAFFKNNAGCEAIFTNANLVDDSGALLKGTLLDFTFFKSDLRKSFKKTELLYWSILLGNIMTGATMAIKREAFTTILPFHLHPGKRLWHDGWIGFSLMAKGSMEYLDECLINYRVHPDQQVGIVTEEDPFGAMIVQNKGIAQKEVIQRQRVNPAGNRKEIFQRYLIAFSFLKELKKIIPLSSALEGKITAEYLERKIDYFKSQPFPERKLRLFKWYLQRANHITFTDLITL